MYSLCHLYKIQRFSTLCRLYGIGYRLLCKLNHTKSSTVLRLKAIWLKAKLPFELWLGQCCPVDPYLKGRLIWKLQQAFRPKDLVVPPTSTYKSETFEYLEDMTLLRSWTEAWLKYVRWYYATALSPDVSIEDFIQAPVVTTRSFQRGVRTSLMLRLRLIENCCGETIAEAGLDPKPLTILGSRLGGSEKTKGDADYSIADSEEITDIVGTNLIS
ncbi:hypothetical protein JHK87_051869 [Glycine soja]|nr:hypothetical protein JHK87_051869 [Glycine soja]